MPVAGAAQLLGQFRALGAERTFVVAPFLGTGEMPGAATTDWYSLGIDEDRHDEGVPAVRTGDVRPARRPGGALDAFDPDDDALVLAMPFDTTTAVRQPPGLRARRPAWVALEDKTTNRRPVRPRRRGLRPVEVVASADRQRPRPPPRPGWTGGAGTVWAGRRSRRASTAGACSCGT